MTEWDELWEGVDWDRVTTIPFITERIKKIKNEGDKLPKILEVFQNQPQQVILWNPAKTHYAWQYPFTTKGGKMLADILDILLDETAIKSDKLRSNNNPEESVIK